LPDTCLTGVELIISYHIISPTFAKAPLTQCSLIHRWYWNSLESLRRSPRSPSRLERGSTPTAPLFSCLRHSPRRLRRLDFAVPFLCPLRRLWYLPQYPTVS